MAKLTKDELVSKISSLVTDEDVAIELMEDVTDSMELVEDTEKESLRVKIEELSTKLDMLKTKYKERFLKGEEIEEIKEEVSEPVEDELEEKEIIDVKEI